MGLVIELLQIFFKVVARLVGAACIQEREQGRLGGRKLILPGKPRARLEATTNFSLVRPGKIFNHGGLAALGSAEEPENRQRRMLPEPLQMLLELGFFLRSGKPATKFVKHWGLRYSFSV